MIHVYIPLDRGGGGGVLSALATLLIQKESHSAANVHVAWIQTKDHNQHQSEDNKRKELPSITMKVSQHFKLTS